MKQTSYQSELLESKRKAKGWTQAFVSEQTGLSRNQIIAMEKGTFTGGIKYLSKYLDLLQLQTTFVEKKQEFPQLHELAELFPNED